MYVHVEFWPVRFGIKEKAICTATDGRCDTPIDGATWVLARLLSHDDFSEVWSQVSGTLGQHSQSGRLRRGTLEIIVANSAVLQELNFQKRQLLKSIQQHLPDHKITDLRFTIGKF